MKLNRKEFSQAISAVSRFTNSRSPLTAMQCLHLEAKDSSLRIRGYGTYGSASIALPCTGRLNSIVPAALLCKTVDLLVDDEIELAEKKNKLSVSGSISSTDVPIQAVSIEPSIGSPGQKITSVAKDVMRCIEVANVVGSNVEMKYANGVRICTSDGKLHFSSATSKNSAFAWCNHSSGDIDVVIARGGISALSKMLSLMDDLTIEDRGSHVAFYSGTRAAILLKEQDGKKPNRYDKIKHMWDGAHKWRVSLSDLREFVRLAMANSTPEASGVWLKPTPSGLTCKYTGISDGTYSVDLSVEATCETHVSGGSCEGKDAYISCRQLSPAVTALEGDEFVINAVDGHALIFETPDAVIGLAQLNLPIKDQASG